DDGGGEEAWTLVVYRMPGVLDRHEPAWIGQLPGQVLRGVVDLHRKVVVLVAGGEQHALVDELVPLEGAADADRGPVAENHLFVRDAPMPSPEVLVVDLFPVEQRTSDEDLLAWCPLVPVPAVRLSADVVGRRDGRSEAHRSREEFICPKPVVHDAEVLLPGIVRFLFLHPAMRVANHHVLEGIVREGAPYRRRRPCETLRIQSRACTSCGVLGPGLPEASRKPKLPPRLPPMIAAMRLFTTEKRTWSVRAVTKLSMNSVKNLRTGKPPGYFESAVLATFVSANMEL